MRFWSKAAVCTALTVLALACGGPPAPDAAVCVDLVHRLCRVPSCDAVADALGVSGDCDTELLANTGCGAGDFRFTTPSRERVLDCREPLLSNGDGTTDVATCTDVKQTLSCDDVVAFLRGEGP